MAHLFEMMYGAFDLDGITVEDLIDIVFTYVLDRNISELERQECRNKSCRASERSLREAMKSQYVGDDQRIRWMNYADKALNGIPPDAMWSVIEMACRVLSLPSHLDKHRAYFDSLFDMSWMVWMKIFNRIENSARIERLTDYITCVFKLKFSELYNI